MHTNVLYNRSLVKVDYTNSHMRKKKKTGLRLYKSTKKHRKLDLKKLAALHCLYFTAEYMHANTEVVKRQYGIYP